MNLRMLFLPPLHPAALGAGIHGQFCVYSLEEVCEGEDPRVWLQGLVPPLRSPCDVEQLDQANESG